MSNTYIASSRIRKSETQSRRSTGSAVGGAMNTVVIDNSTLVEDILTSKSKENALSANMGRLLKNLVDGKPDTTIVLFADTGVQWEADGLFADIWIQFASKGRVLARFVDMDGNSHELTVCAWDPSGSWIKWSANDGGILWEVTFDDTEAVTVSPTVVSPPDIVIALDSSCTNSQVPSAKCMYDLVGNIETLLQSLR